MNDKNAGFYIKRISDYIESAANRELEQYGLTWSQARILSYLLGRQDEPTIQKDIEDFFEIRHPTVIGILQRMESKGFIVSSVDPADKRQRLIRATQSASDLAEKIEKHREEIEDRMAEGMSKDELEELKVLLYKIYKNISHE